MLKMAGAVLVLASSVGMGISISRSMRQHYRQLVGLKELLLMLGNELRFFKVPLPQALERIAGRCEQPYRDCLLAVSGELLRYLEASPQKVWKKTFEAHRDGYLLSEEEFELLLGAGSILEQEGCYMQEEEVRLFAGQVQFQIAHAQEELKTRQRVCRYLCGAGGIFVILVLV